MWTTATSLLRALRSVTPSSGSWEVLTAYASALRFGCHLTWVAGAFVLSCAYSTPVFAPTIVTFFSPPVEPPPPVPHASRLPSWLKLRLCTACVANPNDEVHMRCFGSQSVTKQSLPPVAMCLPVGSAAMLMEVCWCATTATELSVRRDGAGSTWILPGMPPVATQSVSPSGPQTIWFTSICMSLEAPSFRLPAVWRFKMYTWSARLLSAMCFESGDHASDRNSFIALALLFRSTSNTYFSLERVSNTRNLPPQEIAATTEGLFGSVCSAIHSPAHERSSISFSGS
mmetsp:Transcript_23027/g.61442  ORF Transcript_23027/g.61442 Transcript_23027/m.61442 type:complete len:286 (-) Transcript_23027:344-1201(-)